MALTGKGRNEDEEDNYSDEQDFDLQKDEDNQSLNYDGSAPGQ